MPCPRQKQDPSSWCSVPLPRPEIEYGTLRYSPWGCDMSPPRTGRNEGVGTSTSELEERRENGSGERDLPFPGGWLWNCSLGNSSNSDFFLPPAPRRSWRGRFTTTALTAPTSWLSAGEIFSPSCSRTCHKATAGGSVCSTGGRAWLLPTASKSSRTPRQTSPVTLP